LGYSYRSDSFGHPRKPQCRDLQAGKNTVRHMRRKFCRQRAADRRDDRWRLLYQLRNDGFSRFAKTIAARCFIPVAAQRSATNETWNRS
jgi:hypothetical protein